MILTIGHSTRPLAELIGLLRANGVRTLVDVRTVPRSRRNPQFNCETLAGALADAGIHYRHLPELGGLRRPRPDSPNTAWRNASFRGYADHLQTEEFHQGIEAVLALAKSGPVALMCAEALPWRCHRSLIADVLTVRGIPVRHIISAQPPKPHRLTPFAHVSAGGITYPADEPEPS